MESEQSLIIYKAGGGKAAVSLYVRDGDVWMSQSQLAEHFATSLPNVSIHLSKVMKEKEMYVNSVVRNYLTTATDGKDYNVLF